MLQGLYAKGIELKNHINPSQYLLIEYETNVIDARNTLFNYLRKISPKIEEDARNILQKKIDNAPSPLMGELYPWLIQEIVQLDGKVAMKIAVGWLAFYLYTLSLDTHLDKRTMISGEELITLSILEKKGLTDLQSIVIGTDYELLFNESLDNSLIGEIEDFAGFSKNDYKYDLEEVAKKKNLLLLTCASAFAAANCDRAEFILQITDCFLLIMQYLDDLGDWEEDINERHLSLLTIDLFSKVNINLDIFSLPNDEIMEQLIVTGTLYKVLCRINELLQNQITLLRTQNCETNYRIHEDYFSRLYTENFIFIENIKSIQHRYNQLSKIQKIQVIEGIKREINIVAQSS